MVSAPGKVMILVFQIFERDKIWDTLELQCQQQKSAIFRASVDC